MTAADWTTARVVRDKDGDLWGCDGPGPKAYWTGLGSASEVDAWQSDALDRWYGPLTPILDADGMPVVRTVGDLTARHVGRRVRVTLPGCITEFTIHLMEANRAGNVYLGHRPTFDTPEWFPLDTPCELLQEGTDA